MPLNAPRMRQLVMRLGTDAAFQKSFFADREGTLKTSGFKDLLSAGNIDVVKGIKASQLGKLGRLGPGGVAIEISPGFSIK